MHANLDGVVAGRCLSGAPVVGDTGMQSRRPCSFGYKCAWMAVRSEQPSEVMDATRLRQDRRVGWAEGIAAAYHDGIFVSPPVDGWVFVVGFSLLGPGDEAHSDWMRALITAPSRELDTIVQYFGSYRVPEYHAWAEAESGKLVRAYAYVGERMETLGDYGEKTPGEVELGLNFFDERSPEARNDEYWERKDLRDPNEEDVMAVAGKWSINPQTLDEYKGEVGEGWLCRLSKGL
jgi:hypothetical protein